VRCGARKHQLAAMGDTLGFPEHLTMYELGATCRRCLRKMAGLFAEDGKGNVVPRLTSDSSRFYCREWLGAVRK
jgi:hypothetical protein